MRASAYKDLTSYYFDLTFSEALGQLRGLIFEKYCARPCVTLVDNYDMPYGYNSNYNTSNLTVGAIDKKILVESMVVGAFAPGECVRPRSLLMCD